MTEDNKPYHHGNLAETLIAATIAIIEEEGLEQVSVRAVARRAGVSPAAPFRHFPSKSALLSAVAEQAMQHLVARITEAEAETASADPLLQIERIGQAYLNWAGDHPTHFQIVSLRGEVALTPEAQAMNEGIRRTMARHLSEAQALGLLRIDADPALISLSCRAFVYGLSRMYVDGHFPEWQPEGEPADWMRRALSAYIAQLRAG